ncbi:SHC SH2 domain-binding protein 1-like [Asterias amurensis]|uniref:SHC SH2 domain-binding protein 1-like n=1 Tax=Asterias amurensis TaxID=7602 RepID=UPI003AB3E935
MSSQSVTSEDNDDRDSPSKKQKIHQKQSTDVSDTSANTSSDMMANGTGMMTVGDQSEPEPREIQNQTSSNKAGSEEAHPPEEINNNEPKDVEQDLDNLPLKLKMPEVFDFGNLSCQERYDDIFDILADCKPFQVQQAFGLYLNNEGGDGQLELEGSQAVWRSMDLDCDVLVEIVEVQCDRFPITAFIEVAQPFCSVPGLKTITEEQVDDYLQEHKNKVDIVELFPVHDSSGDLDETALAFEHIRFFFKYIWRLSDEYDDGDYIFTMRHLGPRLKLYFDVQEKNVSHRLATMYHTTITDYQTKCRQLSKKQALIDSDDEDSDTSEKEIDVNELVEMTRLRKEISQLQETLEMLENPVMRHVMDLPKGYQQQPSSEVRRARPNKEVITHIVAKKLTAGMIQDLQLPGDTVIEAHTTPASALSCCYDNDTVLIFPGLYSEDMFYSLDQSISIRGIGNPENVILINQESGCCFLECNAHNLTLSNLTIADENGSAIEGVLKVQRGTTSMTDCRFVCSVSGLTVSNGCLKMKNCQVQGAQEAGVTALPGSTLTMTDCYIKGTAEDKTERQSDSDGYGLIIESQKSKDGNESTSKTSVSLQGTKIEHNTGSGILLTVWSSDKNQTPQPIDLDDLCSMTYIDLQVKDSDLDGNKKGAAMLATNVN